MTQARNRLRCTSMVAGNTDGLFIGQSPQFVELLHDFGVEEADAAERDGELNASNESLRGCACQGQRPE